MRDVLVRFESSNDDYRETYTQGLCVEFTLISFSTHDTRDDDFISDDNANIYVTVVLVR